MPLQIHPHIRSLPVGRCIYCGATGTLYEEHIIAYAFGGNLTLKAASCADCGAKTGAMEQHLCDTIFQSVRVHRGFPSRGKRPLVTELYVTKNGQPDKIPASDHPGLLLLPKLDPPWFPKRHPHAVSIRGHLAYTTGSDAKGKLAAFSEGTNLRARFKPDRFSRVLAKIAHGYCVLCLGPDAFLPFLPPVIVGDDHEVGRYVGGTQSDDQQIVSTAPNQLHALEFIGTHYGEETLLICKIRLFADYPETPTYLALTGYLRGEAPTAQPRLLPEEIE